MFSVEAWMAYFTSGQVEQLWILVFLMLFTFVLEDASTLMAASLAIGGVVDPFAGFAAIVIGVYIGDLGLYGLGWTSRRVAWLRRFVGGSRSNKLRTLLDRNLAAAVFVARLLPGTRLAGYTAFGFFRLSFRVFAMACAGSVVAWTTFLYGGAYGLGKVASQWFGEYQYLGVALAVLMVIVIMHVALKWFRRVSMANEGGARLVQENNAYERRAE